MTYLAYAAAAILGLAFSYVGIVFAMLSGPHVAYTVVALLVLAYASVIFYIIRRTRGGNGLPSAVVLALPMILVMVVMQLGVLAVNTFIVLKPDSAPLTSECKTAGVQYIKLPATPVRSIAYDWNTNSFPPVNQFKLWFGTRISSFGRSHSYYPKDIEFIERKRSNLEGRPAQGPDGPFVRFPKVGNYYAVPALTADVLVSYWISPEEELIKPEVHQGIVRYEVTVTDQRTREKLAFLRYIVDVEQMRACGLTGVDDMSDQSFVQKAIGLE